MALSVPLDLWSRWKKKESYQNLSVKSQFCGMHHETNLNFGGLHRIWVGINYVFGMTDVNTYCSTRILYAFISGWIKFITPTSNFIQDRFMKTHYIQCSPVHPVLIFFFSFLIAFTTVAYQIFYEYVKNGVKGI